MARRGIEPIVAALLLVIITIVTVAAVYLFVAGFLSGQHGVARFTFSAEVYDAKFDRARNKLVVHTILRNVGNSPITVTSIKLRDLTKGTEFADVTSVTMFRGGVRVTTPGFKVVIKNPNGYDLVDYQVRIDLSSYLPEPKYLRVVDENGTNFAFCYEQINGECSTSPTRVIWVKIPKIPANGETTLYIYIERTNYAVNGDKVFDFYDDFTTFDSNKWVLVRGYTYFISDGIITLPPHSYPYYPLEHMYTRNKTVTWGEIVELRMRAEGTLRIYTYLWIGLYWARHLSSHDDDLCDYGICVGDDPYYELDPWDKFMIFQGQHMLIECYPHCFNNSVGIRAYDGDPLDDCEWFYMKVVLKRDHTVEAYIKDEEGDEGYVRAVFTGSYDRFYLYILSGFYDGTQIDCIRVRKYADIEPTVTVMTLGGKFTIGPGEVIDTTIEIDVPRAWNAAPGDKFEIVFVFSDGSMYSVIVQTHG